MFYDRSYNNLQAHCIIPLNLNKSLAHCLWPQWAALQNTNCSFIQPLLYSIWIAALDTVQIYYNHLSSVLLRKTQSCNALILSVCDLSLFSQIAEQLMTLAYENGINLFDTAEVYAAGKWVPLLISHHSLLLSSPPSYEEISKVLSSFLATILSLDLIGLKCLKKPTFSLLLSQNLLKVFNTL